MLIFSKNACFAYRIKETIIEIMTIKEHESLSHAEDSISENEWSELGKLSREKRTLIPENIDEPVDKKEPSLKKTRNDFSSQS